MDLAGPGSAPAAASRARKPGFFQSDMTFRPRLVSARLKPVSPVTSQMAPMAARSSHCRISGSVLPSNRFLARASRFSAARRTKTTPAAARLPWPELHPGRFGLTTARQAGGSSRIMWWSMTTTFSPMAAAWATASLAAAPQSTVMTRSAPRAFNVSNARALGP
ncbi:hypothetical protein D3C72_1810650 [compost metagenome]